MTVLPQGGGAVAGPAGGSGNLYDRMAELCDRHGLTPADLNIDLGPLGTLLPP